MEIFGYIVIGLLIIITIITTIIFMIFISKEIIEEKNRTEKIIEIIEILQKNNNKGEKTNGNK